VTVTWVPVGTLGAGAPVSALDRADRAEIDRAPREPAVAFAIGRKVGPAVVRNRLRRRLRDELRSLARQGLLRPGCHLVGVRPEAAVLDGPSLRSHLRQAVVS
jgi:ribonuclease P protein component